MTGTSITKKGLKLLTKILASGEELNFTRAAVGTGSVPAGYDRENMIGLAAYKMDGTISRCVSDPENQQASIVMQVSSVGVTQGFTVTEAGIFAQDPDEGEILYAYTDMTEDPQYIYPEDSEISKFVELTLVVVIGSVEKVTAYINPGSLVTSEEFYDLKKELEDGKTTIEFTEASDRENIESGETISVIFGKIKKWFVELKDAAFCSVVNHCLTTEPGTVLDGRVGTDLQEQINGLKQADERINSNISFPDGSGFYLDTQDGVRGYNTDAARGADTFYPFSGGQFPDLTQGYILPLINNTFDVKTIAPKKYKEYTSANFRAVISSLGSYNQTNNSDGGNVNTYSINQNPSCSYNPNTGIVTVNPGRNGNHIKITYIGETRLNKDFYASNTAMLLFTP
jgi:hypothetical protein